MLKIGTHNSLSYLKNQWWLRWLNFTAKCQNLNIGQQYEAGVRYFDIRIKMTRKGVRGGHGINTYKVDFDRFFRFLNSKGDCVVYLMLENLRWQQSKVTEERFAEYVWEVYRQYPGIRFVGGYKKNPWGCIVPGLPDPERRVCYELYVSDKGVKLPYPLRYARKKNAEYWKGVNDEVWSVFDFVDIKESV